MGLVTIDLRELENNAAETIAQPKAIELAKQILEKSDDLDILDNIESINYLPNSCDLVRLCYLTTINKAATKALCCQKTEIVFKNSTMRTYQTLCGFKLAFIPFAFFALVGLTNFVNLTNLSTDKQNWINFTGYFFGGFGSAMASLYITGVNFYRSERALNEKQETIQSLQLQYNEMAYELARLSISQPVLGKALAKEIKFSRLRLAAAKLGLKKEESDCLYASLQAIKKYVKKGIIPNQHLLSQYIEIEKLLAKKSNF